MSQESPLITSRNQRMNDILAVARKVADSDYPVLIMGETGTGKEVIARLIHDLSPYRDRPFVAESVGAIPDGLLGSELFGHQEGAFSGATGQRTGLLQSADGGTLYLDGIEESTSQFQLHLMRFLQSGVIRPLGAVDPVTVRTRLISSSVGKYRELRATLRDDFFHRISLIQLEIPPLRERKEDIRDLAVHFAVKHGHLDPLPEEILDALTDYSWPGNVRELQNEISLLTLRGEHKLRLRDLSPRIWSRDKAPDGSLPSSSFDEAIRNEERRILIEALRRNNFHRERTAHDLQVSIRWLYRKISNYNLTVG